MLSIVRSERLRGEIDFAFARIRRQECPVAARLIILLLRELLFALLVELLCPPLLRCRRRLGRLDRHALLVELDTDPC